MDTADKRARPAADKAHTQLAIQRRIQRHIIGSFRVFLAITVLLPRGRGALCQKYEVRRVSCEAKPGRELSSSYFARRTVAENSRKSRRLTSPSPTDLPSDSSRARGP